MDMKLDRRETQYRQEYIRVEIGDVFIDRKTIGPEKGLTAEIMVSVIEEEEAIIIIIEVKL